MGFQPLTMSCNEDKAASCPVSWLLTLLVPTYFNTLNFSLFSQWIPNAEVDPRDQTPPWAHWNSLGLFVLPSLHTWLSSGRRVRWGLGLGEGRIRQEYGVGPTPSPGEYPDGMKGGNFSIFLNCSILQPYVIATLSYSHRAEPQTGEWFLFCFDFGGSSCSVHLSCCLIS